MKWRLNEMEALMYVAALLMVIAALTEYYRLLQPAAIAVLLWINEAMPRGTKWMLWVLMAICWAGTL